MDSFKIKTGVYTDRSTLSIIDYLKDINKYLLLTKEEEFELFNKYHNGDSDAFDKIICSNLRFVVSVAKQYQNKGIDLSDLISEGNLGLIKAATKFDETKGFKFISYAIWWIRLYIQVSIIQQSKPIAVPLEEAATIKRINKFIQSYERQTGEFPSIDIISENLQLQESKVNSILNNSLITTSLDSYINEDGDTLHDLIGSKDEYSKSDGITMKNSLKDDINIALESLTPQERITIINFFGLNNTEPMSLAEISSILNITPERVRQIKDVAIKQIRELGCIDDLKQYLG